MQNNINKILSPISFVNYEIIKNHSLGGYKVKLNWNFVPDAKMFKVYKAILPQTKQEKVYNITQVTLEKLSSRNNTTPANNNILYNKEIFKKNKQKEYKFFEIAQIPFNKKNKEYSLVDNNIKLEHGYAYVVTFLNSALQESPKTNILNLSVDDFEHPPVPEDVVLNDSSEGIGVTIKTKSANVVSYKIFRANKDVSKNFNELCTIPTTGYVTFFLDREIVPGNEYEYKIFSIDYYGNKSLEAKKASRGFNFYFINNATIPYPDVKMEKSIDGFIFKVKKNHNNLIGITIQRRDVWRYEQTFTAKDSTKFSWPNVLLFEKDIVEFKDLSADPIKNYQYRIFNVLKNGTPGSYWISPVVNMNEYENKDDNKEQITKNILKIKNFQFEPINHKQNPVYVKCHLDVSGSYDTLTVSYDNKKVNIDYENKSFYLKFDSQKKYIINMSFIKDNEEISSLKNISLNII